MWSRTSACTGNPRLVQPCVGGCSRSASVSIGGSGTVIGGAVNVVSYLGVGQIEWPGRRDRRAVVLGH
jgi:hypothetical protein